MDINSIKGIRALKILNNYKGTNPYILTLKEQVEKSPNKALTETQYSYIVQNENYATRKYDKTVEITQLMGEILQVQERLGFIPKRVMVDYIIGETEKYFHVIGRLSTKQKPKMYMLTKVLIIDDLNFKLKEVNIDFERFDKRLMEVRGYTLLPHQKEAVKFLLERDGAILADDMGLGKAVIINELAITPYGKVRMGDLKVGDEIIGSDGKSTNIIGVYPQGIRDTFRITFNDGFSTIVDSSHLWTVYSNNNSSNRKAREDKPLTLSVEQMLDENGVIEVTGRGYNSERKYKVKTFYKQKNGDSKWQIPIVKPIEYKVKPILPIEPYFLGVSLGDGHFNNSNTIKIKLHEDDFNELLGEYRENEITSAVNTRTATINNLKEEVKSLELENVRSNSKFIPDVYKYASIDERLSLLQGLMDTDGHCLKSKNGMFTGTEYTTISEQLANDVCEIVHSLGGIVRMSSGIGKYENSEGNIVECSKYYKLNIKLSNGMNPFRLKRKAVLYNEPKKYKVGRYIKSIEPVGKSETVCIKVDAKDELFVINHGIVTHNTTSAIVAALETRYKRILIVCPSSVKVNWEREIETFSDNTSIINGRRYAQARFTIINPDILQNFHTLDSKVDPNDPPMYLSRELVNSKFDLIIIDEAHTLRNKKSIRGEIMSELCTKFGKPIVWLLSGTPVANRPKDFYNLLKLIRSPLADNFNHYMTRYCDGKQISKKLANGKTRRIWIANGASNLEELSNKSKHLVLRRLKEDVVDMPDKILSNIFLEMSESSRKEYERVWEEYLLERQRQQKRGNVEREMVELGLLRKFVAMEAIPSTVELAQQAIDDGRKVIIFTTFNDEQQELAEAFGDIAVCHNGSMSIDDKQNSVDMFQNNPKVKVFIGNVISAGSGITLTAGTLTIFNSFSWIPGDNEQAEDRSYRIGQKNDCNVYYMVFKDSVSEVVLNTIRKKRNMIDQIIDGNANRNINELILETVLNG